MSLLASRALSPMARALAFVLPLLAVTSVDQATKHWAVDALALRGTIEVWPGILHLSLHVNAGGAFGIFAGHATLLALASVAVAIAVVAWARRLPATPIVWAIAGAVVGGIASNGLDRVVRRVPGFGELRRGVVDFIAIAPGRWPAFNLADVAIVLGASGLLWLHLRAALRARTV